jgi:hypothetical protein
MVIGGKVQGAKRSPMGWLVLSRQLLAVGYNTLNYNFSPCIYGCQLCGGCRPERVEGLQCWLMNSMTTFALMQPDYPQKVFNDKRSNFVLLMETLAMHS